MATVRIVVLSDGTWETIDGSQEILEITENGYDDLCNGDYKVYGLKAEDILSSKEIE